jgi:hypothetical protein
MLRQSSCQSRPILQFVHVDVSLVVAVSLPRRCCLASYIHNGSVVMMSRRSQASQVTQVKSSIQIESRSSSGHNETASEMREVRCQYRVLRNKNKNKTKAEKSKQKPPKAKSQNATKPIANQTRETTPKLSQTKKTTEETKSTQQRHPSLTSKAQAWVPPSIAPPSQR